ncbi:MAG: cytochrome c-type biogenesis protein CcmH [Gemmatimonadota bacterium]|nr:cytochrome c-type biogenesis protein CcmH [Gemmatimonadota bacterium]MDH5758504.1 cytochrome c-type biogenesis protein CcmH [Gemmatimonadota bacterium]
MMRSILFLSLFLYAPLMASGQRPPASGESIQVHPEAREAIDQLKSPYCPGMMLDVCPSPGGAMLRDSIQSMAAAGIGADSIVSLILAEYGPEWRAEPTPEGTGLWAWLVAPAGLALGLALVWVILGRRRGRRGPAPSFPQPTPEDTARIEAALKILDEEEEPAF